MGNCFTTNKTCDADHIRKDLPMKFIPSAAKLKDLKANYNIDQNVIGCGATGKVFKANNKKDKSIKIAIKVINKKKKNFDKEML